MLLSILGFTTATVGVCLYVLKMKKNNAPKYPILLLSSLMIAMALGSFDIYQQLPIHSLSVFILTLFLTGIATLFFSIFTFLLLQKKPALGNMTVTVGDQLLTFKAITAEGDLFNSEALMGKRTLLKFYRGSWCPYCSAELNLFEQMKPELEKYNVQVVGLCNEKPETIATHIKRDQLSFLLLSDTKLEVIRQYGVEHHKALSPSDSSLKLSYQSMSIPTSILIDENGVIQWIDQLDDYRLRASQERVMAAVIEAF